MNGGYDYGVAGDASGRYLFAIEANNGVLAYAIDAVTGALTAINTLGPGAVSLAVVPAAGAPTATLQSLQIQPAPATLISSAIGVTTQFVALGRYSDGTARYLTSAASWSSSDATVATISNQIGTNGLATTTGYGSTTITATVNGVTASTTLTVTSWPSRRCRCRRRMRRSQAGVQLTATGSFSDSTTHDVTSSAAWSL